MAYEWLNDKAGNPLAAYIPGKGWVTPQNASYGEGPGGTQKWGENELLSRSNLTELANKHYATGRDAQIANTGQYILGSVGGSSDPYFKSFDPTGLDTSGMTEQQKALFNPASNWGSGGYNIWGDPNDPNVGRPKAVYNEKPFVKNDSDNFLWNTAKSAFGFDEGGGGVGAGTILAMWLAAGAAAGAAGGAAGAEGAAAAGAGLAEEAAALGIGNAYGGATGAGAGATGGNWWDSFINSGTNSGISPLEGGGSMPEFDFSDIIEQSGNFTGGESGGNWWDNFTSGDLGETVSPWTTNPSLESLGGDVGSLVNSTYSELVKKVGEQGAKSVLSKLMSGEASASDYINLLGKLGAAGLGMLGSSNQSNSLAQLAQQYQQYGAPSRSRFEASMSPGFDPMSIPGYAGALDSTSKSLLARLSAQGGNPWGNSGGLIEANKAIVNGTAMPAINEYQRLNANTGFGSSMNAALGLQTQGIGADANIYNSLGYGLNALTNQQPKQTSLEDLMKALQMGGLA